MCCDGYQDLELITYHGNTFLHLSRTCSDVWMYASACRCMQMRANMSGIHPAGGPCAVAHVSTMPNPHDSMNPSVAIVDPLLLSITRRAPELECLVSPFRFHVRLGISANRNECSEAAFLRSSPARKQISPASDFCVFVRLIIDNVEALVALTLPFKIH